MNINIDTDLSTDSPRTPQKKILCPNKYHVDSIVNCRLTLSVKIKIGMLGS